MLDMNADFMGTRLATVAVVLGGDIGWRGIADRMDQRLVSAYEITVETTVLAG